MKKKVDQIFVENFRSWSGRHYFDLNDINFLFGSNSSGKSSIIHAFSLLKQSLIKVSPDGRVLNALKPNGYYIDLGSINKQAYTVIKDKKIKTSEFISFGYIIKGIDNLINIGNPLLYGRLSKFKTIELFKNLNEIKLTCKFSSLTGKLDTIKLEIDELEIIKIKDNNKKFEIYLPQNEDFWKQILNISPILKNGKEEDFILEVNANKKIEEISVFMDKAEDSTTKLELDNALLENKVLENELISDQLSQISNLEDTIKYIINILYKKMVTIGFSDIKPKDGIDEINFMFDLTDPHSLRTFIKSNKNNISDLYVKLSSWHDFNKDKNEIKSELVKLTNNFHELFKLTTKASKENDLNEYIKDLNNLNEVLNEVSILNLTDNKYVPHQDNWTEINNFMSPFVKVFFFLRRFKKTSFFFKQVDVAKNNCHLEKTNLKKSIIQNLAQIQSYKDIIKDYTRIKEELRSKNVMTFKKFMGEIIENPYISIDSKDGFVSISDILNINYVIKFKETLFNFIQTNITHKGTSPLDLLRLVQNSFLHNFRALKVIGPHRKRPDRIEIINQHHEEDDVGINGENISNILNKASSSQIRELNKRIKDLEIPYSVSVKKFKEDNTIAQALVTDVNGLSVSLSDVGYGVGQVLPIVIECITSKNRIITIEQPELHLHPKLQANLTDLIIWSSQKNNNRFILETHSEHMILRLQRRLRENFEKGEKSDPEITNLSNSITINVVTMNKKERKSENKLLKITPSGNFKGKWPEGFFEERFVELGIE